MIFHTITGINYVATDNVCWKDVNLDSSRITSTIYDEHCGIYYHRNIDLKNSIIVKLLIYLIAK